MIDKSVMQQLLSFSPIENKQYQNKHFYPDLANKYLNKNQQVLVINHKLLSHRPVYISKHNRFAPYPLHQHNLWKSTTCFEASASKLSMESKSICFKAIFC